MNSVLVSKVEYHGFEPWSGQTKDYKIGICYFSAEHAVLRSKNKDWFAQNQNNVSECLPTDCWFSEVALASTTTKHTSSLFN